MKRDRTQPHSLTSELFELLLYAVQMGILLAAAGGLSKLFGIL